MNLRDKKGFSGVDISISVIIILIFIPTIFGVIYNSSKLREVTSRQATSITKAVEIIEEAKGIVRDIKDSQIGTILEDQMIEKHKNDKGFYRTDSTSGDFELTFQDEKETTYKVEVNYEKPDLYKEYGLNLVERVKVKVTYPTGNTTKAIEMSTVLKKDIEDITGF